MNKLNLCIFCVSGVLLSAPSIGMQDYSFTDTSVIYPVENRVIAENCDNRQIRMQYRENGDQNPALQDFDRDLVNHFWNCQMPLVIIFRTVSHMPEDEEEDGDNLVRNETYSTIDNWFNHTFPTGENEEEMQRIYGSYTFSYTPGPYNSLKMEIESNDGTKSTSAILDKNGWIVLGYKNGVTYYPCKLYYKNNKNSIHLKEYNGLFDATKNQFWEVE